jgi:hypothetical protein
MTLQSAEPMGLTPLHFIFVFSRLVTISSRVRFLCDKFDADPGLAYCPVNASCMTDTSWNNDFNSILKLAVSKLPATVVYARQNDSVLDIIDVGTPQPANYTPNDFFPFFNMAGTNETGGDYTGYIDHIATQQDSSDPYTNTFILMAIPIALFNNASWNYTFPDENWNTTGSLALPSYRVYFLHLVSLM